MSDLAFLAAFFAGCLFTGFVFWGWNRELRRNGDYWHRRYRAADSVLSAMALAHERPEIASENADNL